MTCRVPLSIEEQRDKARGQRDLYKGLLRIADENLEHAKIRNAVLCGQLRAFEDRIDALESKET